MQAAPGGPFTAERKLPPKIEQQMNESYGLDQPLYVQYKDYLVNVANWDFGPSFKQKGQSVNTIINLSFTYSLFLCLDAIFLVLLVCVFIGVFDALFNIKLGDYDIVSHA